MRVFQDNQNRRVVYFKPSEWEKLDQPAGVYIIFKKQNGELIHIGETPDIKATFKYNPKRGLSGLLDHFGYRVLVLEGKRIADLVQGGIN